MAVDGENYVNKTVAKRNFHKNPNVIPDIRKDIIYTT